MIARLLGKNAVGYVSWASTLSLYPLVICNAMARIYLPAFSSAASDPSAAPLTRGEISAHQRQHCLAGLCRAGQLEHSHHRPCIYRKVVSGAAAALRLLH